VARAAAYAERAGVPAVAFICHGFTTVGETVAKYEGLADLRVVTYPPPNISVQKPPEVAEQAALLVDEALLQLSRSATGKTTKETPPETYGDKDIVCRGNLAQVNQFFYHNQWTDGLPVVPPTIKDIKAMLECTDRSPDEVIGILPPGRCEATVWKVAANGVMAGCRPEYMPLLVALVEAIAEPRFALQHAGSTAGWTPLIILNGPIIKELDFNSGQGVLRPERQANITVSRFLRLCMVNIARYRSGATDMAAFGNNYLPVLAETVENSPWPPLCEDLGFKPDSNVVTVLSSIGTGYHFVVRGTAEEHLKVLVQETVRTLGSQMVYVMTTFGKEYHPVIGMTPLVASIIAEAGYTKDHVRRYIYDNARIPAYLFDDLLQQEVTGLTIDKAMDSYDLPADFHKNDDPNRLVPLLHGPEELYIVVTGFPQRNRAFVMAQIGSQGLATAKEIKLPENRPHL
jgi:hypothetical protein